MNHLTQDQKEKLKKQLEQEKKELEKNFQENANFGLEYSLSESVGELSTYDNHPADLGSEMFEHGKDLALNEQAEFHLLNVEKALHRFQTGEYGTCIVCGKNIPFERLEAIPETAYCKEDVPNPHISNRPVEEKIMSHSLDRIRRNELIEEPSPHDGEDAWQIVSSWGTSNTPALSADPEMNDYDDMLSDENSGYVEKIESFLATDIYGKDVSVIKNQQYQSYVDHNEGDTHLVIESEEEEEW